MDRLALETPILKKITIKGVVQGVGFRPFIFRHAAKHQIKGWIINTSSGVEMEIEGTINNIERFISTLEAEAPPISQIESILIEDGEFKGFESFEIRESRKDFGYQLISPDIALCPDCLKELFDPKDRRYLYPFINCTNCGPRFTIIQDIPYDRASTTMSAFPMCPTCLAEFNDPLNRRFHAQPNACPVCGPQIFLTNSEGVKIDTDNVITRTAKYLREGKIIAIKGLGGFHLACDAQNEQAIETLRERKNRPHKPFALMMLDMQQIKKHCEVSKEEEDLLCSPQTPIVLLKRRDKSIIPYSVAPNNNYLGVMLPYTPIHHLLMREFQEPLIMTSGNLSEEPIVYDNQDALDRLGRLADFFLFNNRDIYTCYDDSVFMVFEGKPYPIRRARSYAPSPIKISRFNNKVVLACGADLKNTFCFLKDNYAFLSQHNGDLEDFRTFYNYQRNIDIYKKIFRVEPDIICSDLHPDYYSTSFASEFQDKLPSEKVQHHHAHIASCMAENGLNETVIGISFDGLGLGTDGNLWGGEFLITDYKTFQRYAHLEYLPVPGGDKATKYPYRLAYSYIKTLLGFIPNDLPVFKNITQEEKSIIESQIEKGINSPLTSSCGRLFDAVSSLLNICQEVTYEGQAAIELEMVSEKSSLVDEFYPFSICSFSSKEKLYFNNHPNNMIWENQSMTVYPKSLKEVSYFQKEEPYLMSNQPKYQICLKELFGSIYQDIICGNSPADIGLKFHYTVALMILHLSIIIRKETNINKVVLSGGCFQNRLLLNLSLNLLRKYNFETFIHGQVPTNDGGISLGQAVITDVLSSSSSN